MGGAGDQEGDHQGPFGIQLEQRRNTIFLVCLKKKNLGSPSPFQGEAGVHLYGLLWGSGVLGHVLREQEL